MQTSAPVIAKDLEHLKTLITQCIAQNGPACDLNHIDVSQVTSFEYLFHPRYGVGVFRGDISKWNVGKAYSMIGMFEDSVFNGDISGWDVSNVRHMNKMFSGSSFTGDISNWDVSNAFQMSYMFAYSKFNGDLSGWNVERAEQLDNMFFGSYFNGDIGRWRFNSDVNMESMLYNDVFNGDVSRWCLAIGTNYDTLFSPSFLGKAPFLEEEEHSYNYQRMFGSHKHLTAYLEKTPFGLIHADLFIRGDVASKNASNEALEQCQNVLHVGEALGLGRLQLCQSMVQQVHRHDEIKEEIRHNLFEQDPETNL